MAKPKHSEGERKRLETLRALNILDTPPEERFDRVTRLARRLFDVPIVLISLVDENRQWFKSRQGVSKTETPREISFCAHAILENQTLVVPDASKDDRYLDNPLVTQEPFIKFYAGHPLSAPNGSRLGTLCLIDRRPREMSADDLQLIRDLAAMVEDEIAAIQEATIDALTGLSNRRGFEALGNKAFVLCQRTKSPASVLFVDIDGLKKINDNFGHEEGDRALKLFSELLLDTFRESDVVARIGGDEFVVFLSGSSEQENDTAFHRLEANTRAANENNDLPFELRFSAGSIAYTRSRHPSLGDLLREADLRMYENKRRKHQAL